MSCSALFDVTVIFVLGGPGAGKGTQCAKLLQTLRCRHLSVGDLLRAEKGDPDSQYGRIIARNMQEGRIGPAEITTELLRKAIETSQAKNAINVFLIDGFPRNKNQLAFFEEKVVSAKLALFLDTPNDVRLSRLLKRADGQQRQDDIPNAIKKRFDTFENDCMPVIRELQNEGRCISIDSSKSEAEVFSEIQRSLEDIIPSLF